MGRGCDGVSPPKMGTGECDAEAIVLKTDAVKQTEQETELFAIITIAEYRIFFFNIVY